MAEEQKNPPVNQQIFSEINTRLRDSEDKQRLLRDRVLLIGNTIVEQRTKSFSEIQKLKKSVMNLEEETKKMSSMLKRITEQLSSTARKEELMILQRQFDLFRK